MEGGVRREAEKRPWQRASIALTIERFPGWKRMTSHRNVGLGDVMLKSSAYQGKETRKKG